MIDFGVNLHCKDILGRGVLHAASANGHAKTVSLLVRQGLDKDTADDNGSTPLHDACQEGKHDVAKILLDLGVNQDAEDSLRSTPLDVAQLYG